MRSTMESDFEAVKHRKRNTARDKPPFFWAASALIGHVDFDVREGRCPACVNPYLAHTYRNSTTAKAETYHRREIVIRRGWENQLWPASTCWLLMTMMRHATV